MSTTFQLIEKIPFFDAFDEQEKKVLAANPAAFAQFEDGDVLIQQGDFKDSSVFVVLSGAATVRKDEYQEQIIDYIEAGAVVGEAAFLAEGRCRMASVIADGAMTVFRLDRNTIEQFDCSFQLKITRLLVTIIVERLDKMHTAMAELMR
ncbi:MAG: cyclic nucleotide-binding domain-containing protein [Magnetococcales bacterium]|nr:cyclic nucleotide-binding domain-containing protein [Magnetococcales bacterium]